MEYIIIWPGKEYRNVRIRNNQNPCEIYNINSRSKVWMWHKQHITQHQITITQVHENKCENFTTRRHGRILYHTLLRQERICICGNNRRNIWTNTIRLLSQSIPDLKIAPFGYFPSKITPGLSYQITRTIKFTLVLDESGVKCVSKEYDQRLLNSV